MSGELLAVLATFGVALVPVLELRAGIPVGMALGLPTIAATATAVLGNIVQIKLAMLVIAWAYRWLVRFPRIGRWVADTEIKVRPHAALIERWGWVGLALFVLLPLPGTGVWGGVLVSRLLGLGLGAVWMGLALGVALSGTVIGLGAHGALTAFRFLQ